MWCGVAFGAARSKHTAYDNINCKMSTAATPFKEEGRPSIHLY